MREGSVKKEASGVKPCWGSRCSQENCVPVSWASYTPSLCTTEVAMQTTDAGFCPWVYGVSNFPEQRWHSETVKHESHDPEITQLLFFLQWVIPKCLGGGRLDIVLGAKNQHVVETKPWLSRGAGSSLEKRNQYRWFHRWLWKWRHVHLARKSQTNGCGWQSWKTSWIRWHLGRGLKKCEDPCPGASQGRMFLNVGP